MLIFVNGQIIKLFHFRSRRKRFIYHHYFGAFQYKSVTGYYLFSKHKMALIKYACISLFFLLIGVHLKYFCLNLHNAFLCNTYVASADDPSSSESFYSSLLTCILKRIIINNCKEQRGIFIFLDVTVRDLER